MLCEFLIDVPGRAGGCGLYVELGDWELVHTDPRYVEHVHPHWIKAGVPNCGDWRGPGCCYGPEWTKESKRAYRLAAERPGTPVEIQRIRGLIPEPEPEPEPAPIPRSEKPRVPLGQRPRG